MYSQQGESGVAGETLAQSSRWFSKAQRLSKELLLMAPYPLRVHVLANLALSTTDTTKLVLTQDVS